MGADSVDGQIQNLAVFLLLKLGNNNLLGKGDTALGRRAGPQKLVMLGERIRSRRTKLCLSQEALAEKAGISANTVSRIEGGQRSRRLCCGRWKRWQRACGRAGESILRIWWGNKKISTCPVRKAAAGSVKIYP